MPRPNGPRRVSASTERQASFAMQRPKRSVHVTSSTNQKVGAIKEPLGPSEAWIRDAYGYYNVVGEIAFVMNLTADTLSSCTITPMEKDDSVAPGGSKETADERVLRVWDNFVPAKGGKPELMRRAALQIQIAGESYLIGHPTEKKSDGLVWEFCSTREIQYLGPDHIRRDFGGWGGKPIMDLPVGTDISRFYRPDPEFGTRSDCALKHLLSIAQEVVLLSMVVDAVAKSRLSAGILFIPEEMSLGPEDEMVDDSDDGDQRDPFTQELIEQLIEPVAERDSQASLVPLIMRGPGEFFDKVKLIDVARDLDKLFSELRKEAIHRLAVGLDVPPEMLEGKSNLSHWGSYNVDSQFISKHVVPIGVLLSEFLTESYLRTSLIAYEGMSEEEAGKYYLKFDASKITSKQDASGNARAAWDRVAISDNAYLRENGFDESDAPTEEEKKIRDLRNLMEAEPVVFGPQIIAYLYPDLKGLLVVPGFDEDGNPIEAAPVSSTDGDPGNPSSAPERKNHTGPSAREVRDQDSGQGEPAQRGPGGGTSEETAIAKLHEMADEAFRRAMERASAMSNGATFDVKTDAGGIFEGAWAGLSDSANTELVNHFTSLGYSAADARTMAGVVVDDLIRGLHSFAIAASSAGSHAVGVPTEIVVTSFRTHSTVNASIPKTIRKHDAG